MTILPIWNMIMFLMEELMPSFAIFYRSEQELKIEWKTGRAINEVRRYAINAYGPDLVDVSGFTPPQVAVILCCSVEEVYRLMDERKLKWSSDPDTHRAQIFLEPRQLLQMPVPKVRPPRAKVKSVKRPKPAPPPEPAAVEPTVSPSEEQSVVLPPVSAEANGNGLSKPKPTADRLLFPTQAAGVMGIPLERVLNLIRTGRLRAEGNRLRQSAVVRYREQYLSQPSAGTN
ncbi:MAG TPA: hypothetical protein VF974_06440 [Patescibacteria group bacterium]